VGWVVGGGGGYNGRTLFFGKVVRLF